jgi:hypothetical protein
MNQVSSDFYLVDNKLQKFLNTLNTTVENPQSVMSIVKNLIKINWKLPLYSNLICEETQIIRGVLEIVEQMHLHLMEHLNE